MAADATTSASSSSAAYLPPALPTSRQDIQAAVAKAADLRAPGRQRWWRFACSPASAAAAARVAAVSPEFPD